MKQDSIKLVLFWVILGLFITVAILTILAIFGEVIEVDEEYKDQLFYAFFGEIAAAIFALFYATFGLQRRNKKAAADVPSSLVRKERQQRLFCFYAVTQR